MTARRLLSTATLVALSTLAGAARADDAADVLAKVSTALSQGETRAAIEACESFADRGGLHPDVSFDRGVAYLERAKTNASPGDLGRAAAAFEETRWLRPGDADADAALEMVRAEVARRRARGGEAMAVDANPSAWRAVVGLLPEEVWAVLAASGSIVLAVGLALRLARAARARLAAGVVAGLGLVLLVIAGPSSALARHVRRSTSTAVIVVEEARLLDEHAVPTSLPAIPEAARVDVLEHRGSLAKVRWGIVEGYTPASNLRIVRPAAE